MIIGASCNFSLLQKPLFSWLPSIKIILVKNVRRYSYIYFRSSLRTSFAGTPAKTEKEGTLRFTTAPALIML